jgi:hypothetical protein
MLGMKRLSMTMVLPLCLLAACSDGPTKEESVQIFAAASTAASSVQARAVTDARSANGLAAADQLTLDFSGPCTLGGTASVNGSYEGDSNDDHATFDLNTKFVGCHEATGTIDGELHWTSTADANGFSASMTGDLDWTGSNGSASCGFDVSLQVSATDISYSGSLCGYDVSTELHIGA